MTVLGIIAAVAIPNYLNFVRDVRAAQAVGDAQAVRAAAYMYFGDHQNWPPEEAAGIVPASLVPYLPSGILFFKRDYRVDYDNWIVAADPADGSGGGTVLRSRFPATGVLVGVSVVSNDREFMKAARGVMGLANTVNIAPNRMTLIIAGEKGF